jgi:alpha-L-rhamnosidase
MRIILILVVGLTVLLTACTSNAEVEIFDLRIENLNNPSGLATLQPRFSWKITSKKRGLYQEAYQILVASTEEKLTNNDADLWNSGKIVSAETILIPYGGAPMRSRQACFWKVKIWTNQGEVTATTAFWTMGLLEDSDWKAKWIGIASIEADGEDRKSDFRPKNEDELRLKSETRLHARYLRKEFKLKKEIKNAELYISGLGLYEAYLNGNKIGEQVLAPTPTDYSKTVPYNTFDITAMLQKGNNAFGVVLGNGRFFSMRIPWFRTFGLPQLLAQMEVTYTDNTKDIIVSDESWKITINGPIGSNNEFDGEEYDARKEMLNWHKTGFDDHNWLAVEIMDTPYGKLVAQENLNIRVMEIIKPVSITKLSEDKYIIDMGQNMVGWINMTVQGERGSTVQLRFAELLQEDGNLYTDNLRGAKATDLYTLKGEGVETWEPSFVFHGFRYVEITNYPGEPKLENFTGKVIYDEMETTGSFETSNQTINQIYKNSYWGIRGNYRGMPTDCPQRDERMGWLGDRTTGAHGESFIFDNYKLYVKWLQDIQDSQRENGALPDVAPNYWEMYTDDITWPAAYFTIADMLYNQYGDVRPIINHYDSFKRWLTYIQHNFMQNYIFSNDTFGDWCMPPELLEMIHSKDPARKTSGDVLATAFYYRLVILMQKFAQISGNENDTIYYKDLGEKIKTAFNAKFYNENTKNYSNNTVTANLLAVMHDIAPDSVKKEVFKHIANKTEHEFNSHVSTGLIGIQWLMRALSDYGRTDLAYKIATNTTYPSWGYMIENDATTIWELWNGNTAEPSMNSANHVMLLGDLIIWYYEYLAGIKTATNGQAYKNIIMKPYIIDGLTHVNASYNSPRGKIKSHWRLKNNRFNWDITIPGNTTARVYLPPISNGKQLTESGKLISEVKDIKYLGNENGQTVLEISSGNYAFEIK